MRRENESASRSQQREKLRSPIQLLVECSPRLMMTQEQAKPATSVARYSARDRTRLLTCPDLQLLVQRELHSYVTNTHQTRRQTLVEGLETLRPVDSPNRVESVTIPLGLAVLDGLGLERGESEAEQMRGRWRDEGDDPGRVANRGGRRAKWRRERGRGGEVSFVVPSSSGCLELD